MQRKYVSKKQATQRAAVIRRQNVQRHERGASMSKLREELQRNTANRNRQMEHDRLLAASLRHSGLDGPGLARLNQLQAMLR